MQRELSSSVQFTLYIDLNKVGTEVLTQLITLLRAYPGGNPVRLFLMKGNLEIHSEAGFKFRVSRSQELIEKLSSLLGKDNVGIRKC
jgi:hypothetical protein